jgi:2-haloacid dehalogenase
MLERVRACVFDAYGTLLDVNSAVARNSAAIGENADSLSALWRQRQLEYTWTRSLMKQYADFWVVTEDALEYALNTFGLSGRTGLKDSLMNSYLEVTAYPDVAETLRTLRSLGLTTAILSNGTPKMLQQALLANNLMSDIDLCLSVDELKIYKPDPGVYQFVCTQLGVPAQQICFISSNAWDLAGAASFGLKAVWINRKNHAREYDFAALYSQQPSLCELPALLRGDGLPNPSPPPHPAAQ